MDKEIELVYTLRSPRSGKQYPAHMHGVILREGDNGLGKHLYYVRLDSEVVPCMVDEIREVA